MTTLTGANGAGQSTRNRLQLISINTGSWLDGYPIQPRVPTATQSKNLRRTFARFVNINDPTSTMPTLALPQLSSIPEFEESHSFNLPYPLRRSPSNICFVQTTRHDDISPGRSTVCLTFHLLQAEETVNRTTQYQVDRLSKWSHIIGDIERTVGNMGGFHILKIHCADGKDVRRMLRRGERVWERCSRTKEAGQLQERVKIEVIMSSAS